LQLGALLLLGQDGKSDPVHALDWFRRSATAGYPPAMYNTGILCLRTHLPQCDDGIKEISRSANLGYAPAQTALGNALVDGKYGLSPDPRKGFEWLKRAAKQKFPNAQYSLGLLYLGGVHGKPDLPGGVSWLRKAADQGFAPAEDVLGRMYLLGKGLAPDLHIAEIMLTAATQHGSDVSFIPLAYIHLKQQRFDKAYVDVLCAERSAEVANQPLLRSIGAAAEERLSVKERSTLKADADSWTVTHVGDPTCSRGTCVAPLEGEQLTDPLLRILH
jgi:hypothetical protein